MNIWAVVGIDVAFLAVYAAFITVVHRRRREPDGLLAQAQWDLDVLAARTAKRKADQ
jgi:hypothetical protein